MQCPKCYGEMETISDAQSDHRIDRCSQCFGFYFDHLTKSDLQEVEGKNVLDTGILEPDVKDDMVYVECPKCNRIMDQRKIDQPVQIRFELCPSCYAAFLDAGEFRQYFTEDFRQGFRSLLPD